ncbi:hypothetical protein P8452_32474 [Trifolium repens]|nr:hypothetical protein P8452_32474 [Trifolium repens]
MATTFVTLTDLIKSLILTIPQCRVKVSSISAIIHLLQLAHGCTTPVKEISKTAEIESIPFSTSSLHHTVTQFSNQCCPSPPIRSSLSPPSSSHSRRLLPSPITIATAKSELQL